jgi:ABC-type hemin transport system ATPase subunit
MKLIIAGSRTLNPSCAFLEATIVNFNISVTEVVSGGALGVDSCAKELCNQRFAASYLALKLKDRCLVFLADWDRYGKAAGAIRNKQMAEYADALLLIWDGKSRGSANMKETMLKLNKPVYEVIISVP